ncbi:16S rRNA (guanine(966)-N(2))-methyltransferase RsmD [Paenibacillus sacheonensis]|uniref:16S rRNA (Guanine(966)-N(2))-methyltransferase RsmD n=1 Tax=Paenibacillus sacheonensis TaxID=742054 RepID=A0A7X5BXY8_9BACL|nr:16S rRNA (guanine(966)-N(2))-methyltransferase RsmD [Paenibacillus sacheonensis]MBM7564565.1 16S rRNA (guanine966-N2)-methyltransferase [Paenibacillus sacheonensis]NBC69122.1 16S rRNA (guanine(966)-N(2))-methyltransferase RsmD [Paenibacillus sacheonensis]
MRVIAGTAKGRSLKAVPGKNTRPTTDKVKEAIFSMIGPYFEGGLVLDLFAGTGGLGIEALSRGMDKAVFIDLEGASIEVIKQNVQAAGMAGAAEIYRTEAVRAVKALAKRDLKFALVFLDPPYRMTDMDELMAELLERGLLEEDATIVVEHDAYHRYPQAFAQYRQIKRSEYGDTAVTVYRFVAEQEEEASED